MHSIQILNSKVDLQDDENLLKVKSVLRGSPASGSGVIAVGDVIVAVDGEDMYGSSLAGVRRDPRCTIRNSKQNSPFHIATNRQSPFLR
jgi:C-terminal processing protease CtpA/Prc